MSQYHTTTVVKAFDCVLSRVCVVNVAVSRDGSSDAGSTSSVTGSPHSPRTGLSGQPEKTMSAIAATHQTMTSLLSKPS